MAEQPAPGIMRVKDIDGARLHDRAESTNAAEIKFSRPVKDNSIGIRSQSSRFSLKLWRHGSDQRKTISVAQTACNLKHIAFGSTDVHWSKREEGNMWPECTQVMVLVRIPSISPSRMAYDKRLSDR